MTVGMSGAGKDGDACTRTAGVGGGCGGGTAVRERVQGSEIGQCECCICDRESSRVRDWSVRVLHL